MPVRRLLVLPVLLLLLLPSACSSLGYYTQAVAGQLQLLARRQPIDSLLRSAEVSPELKLRLQSVQQILAFAGHELGLPAAGQYTTYVELERPFVVWNVFAAPEFSLQARTWCYPVAGCVAYRGWFDEAAAQADARRLQEAGYDVFVGGVAAYSTLGWFSDPVLSTVLNRDEHRLAMLLFHELAHQVVYVPDDSVFNESFATAVEQLGLEQWLRMQEAQGLGSAAGRLNAVAMDRRLQADFVALVQAAVTDLGRLYARDMDEVTMRLSKAERIAQLRHDYAALKQAWGGDTRYDAWFSGELNNARLASVATYNAQVPAFEAVFRHCARDWHCFHARATELAQLPHDARQSALQAVLEFSPSDTTAR